MSHRRAPLALALAAFAALLLLPAGFHAPAHAQGTPVTSGGTPVHAKETTLQRIQKMVARINAEAGTPEGEQAVVERLSAQLGVPADSLRAQRSTWGLGYGEVAMVYGFARASKKPGTTPDQIVEMRSSGMAWEAIGKELGVRVDTVAARMKKNVAPKAKPQHK